LFRVTIKKLDLYRLIFLIITLYSPFRWYLPSPEIVFRNPFKMPSGQLVADPAMLGTPDFGIIKIDIVQTAKALQEYLDIASNLTGVSLDDINITVTQAPADSSKLTLVDLLKLGMKLFDAIVWLSAGRPTSHPLKTDPTMTADQVASLKSIADAVFYCYFILVTQARYPVRNPGPDSPKMPNFLTTIMGLDEPQGVYVKRICSFEPQKFDPKWAKYVKFEGFGQEVLSRFGLGVAGYRMFGPFALYRPRAGLSQDLMAAYEFARKVAMAPATWDMHPLTRDPNILTKRGNLNKNLANLILDCFTDDQINEMTKSKVLYKKPEREPNHRNYLTWSSEDNVSGLSVIFVQTTN